VGLQCFHKHVVRTRTGKSGFPAMFLSVPVSLLMVAEKKN
jgi:hypothetical protein